jgi:hypothetical protein
MHNDDMTEMVARIKGFETCELGACKTWDNGRLVTRMIYDGELMIAQIMEEHGDTWEEAAESVGSEVVGNYIGDSSPIVMMRVNMLGECH